MIRCCFDHHTTASQPCADVGVGLGPQAAPSSRPNTKCDVQLALAFTLPAALTPKEHTTASEHDVFRMLKAYSKLISQGMEGMCQRTQASGM